MQLAKLKAQKEIKQQQLETKTREALSRIHRAGLNFNTGPPRGVVQYNMFGDIASAEGFDDTELYIEYKLILPTGWKWSPNDR